MLDINLTYGCILSISDTLDLIKKDEAEVFRQVRHMEMSNFGSLPRMGDIYSTNSIIQEESKVENSFEKRTSSIIRKPRKAKVRSTSVGFEFEQQIPFSVQKYNSVQGTPKNNIE